LSFSFPSSHKSTSFDNPTIKGNLHADATKMFLFKFSVIVLLLEKGNIGIEEARNEILA